MTKEEIKNWEKEFDKQFQKDNQEDYRVTGWLRKNNADGSVSIARPEDIKDFISNLLSCRREIDDRVSKFLKTVDTQKKYKTAITILVIAFIFVSFLAGRQYQRAQNLENQLRDFRACSLEVVVCVGEEGYNVDN